MSEVDRASSTRVRDGDPIISEDTNSAAVLATAHVGSCIYPHYISTQTLSLLVPAISKYLEESIYPPKQSPK